MGARKFSFFFSIFSFLRWYDYLFFHPIHRYFKKVANSDHISAWKSKRLSNDSTLNFATTKLRVKIDKRCLKQDKMIFIHKKVVNIHIA